jgi:hypothetical protein
MLSTTLEPDYRLVARSWERDWHEQLTVLDQSERD